MNLANDTPRTVQQDDRIGRRSSIIPERRDTRAPEYRPAGDMRSAQRGNGGAANLMRTLGIVDRAVSDFQEYAQADYAAKEQDNIARGAADQQLASVDPQMMEKSEGYRNAVTKGRTVSNFNDAVRDFEPELRELIEHQDDPDLAVRQTQVKERLEQFYHGFALDPETGKPKDFMQSPGALRYLAEAIGKTRSQFEAAAMERIEGRFNQESRANAGKNVVDQIRTTGGLDLGLYRSMLPATVTDEQARETLLHALPEGAATLWAEKGSVDGLKVYDALLGKPKPVQSATPELPEGAAFAAPSAPSAAPQGLPVSGGRVTSRFGAPRESRLHNGVDIAVPTGTPVRAAMGGEVTRVWTDEAGGLSMKVRYEDGSVAGFAHLSAADLQVGARVQAGDVVAKTGNSGRSTGPHLHWTLTRDGRRVDPMSSAGAPGAAAGSVGAPDDPVAATPRFRLARPDADPVTAYEMSGEVPTLLGADKLGLTVEDLGKLREERNQLAARIRAEWTRKTEEDQEFNSTGLALRLYGQGQPVTSVDITRAIQAQAVSPQQGMQLYSILRQNANAAQSDAERAEARADRAEAKAREEQAAAISGRYIGAILSGRMTAPQARSAVLSELPTIRDPKVQVAVANAVLAASGDIETARNNSQPVRDAARRFADKEDEYVRRLTGVHPFSGRQRAEQVSPIFNLMQAEFAARLAQGEDPVRVEADVVRKYKPRLDVLLPRPPANK